MPKKNRIPLLLLLLCTVEGMIYLWAVCMTEPEFVFDKCARNSGRVSSLINLAILLMIGYYGIRKIYREEEKKDALRILITFFATNHLFHFFFVFQNFKHHVWGLSLTENLHGFITFIFILMLPPILWMFNNLNRISHFVIIIHLFNVSYFIMKTFYSKVKPEHPAYHNQLGIVITSAALLYIVYRIFSEGKVDTQTQE